MNLKMHISPSLYYKTAKFSLITKMLNVNHVFKAHKIFRFPEPTSIPKKSLFNFLFCMKIKYFDANYSWIRYTHSQCWLFLPNYWEAFLEKITKPSALLSSIVTPFSITLLLLYSLMAFEIFQWGNNMCLQF